MQALSPRWAPSVLRAAGGWCRGCSSSAELGGPKPLKEWTLVVGPRGRLRVRLPCQVSVRPLDPQRYPGADRVLVTVSGVERSARRHLEHVQVRYDEALQLLAIAAEGMDSKAAVDVRTPGKFGAWGGGGAPPGRGLSPRGAGLQPGSALPEVCPARPGRPGALRLRLRYGVLWAAGHR